MSGIAVFLPSEVMCRQAEEILKKRNHHVIANKATTIDNVVEETRKAIELGANIVVSRGHQASDVKQYTSIPTVEVVMTAQELGLLIVKAKKLVHKPFPKIGLFCWKGMLCDTTYFEQLHEVHIATFELVDKSDWFERVEHGISEGIDVLIGGEKCVQYAVRKGLPAVFLATTGESIEIAINQAETMYEMAEFEKHSYAQFSTVLDSSFNGIIKIGEDGTIQMMNRVMEEMLKTHIKSALGQHVCKLLPSLDKEMIGKILQGTEETYSVFISNEKNAMVAIAEPIVVERIITGAIVSCNRIRRLEWSEDKMKEKLQSGFVAHETLENLLQNRPGLKTSVDLAKIYAQSSSPILLESNSYEELELFCQGIHNYSLRKNGPYVVTNIANVPVERQMHTLFGILETGFDRKNRGALIKADDGTLVIRAIDKMTLPVQRYLLNVIRKKRFGLMDVENESIQHVDARIIVCTSKDIKKMVREGSFRNDLYQLLMAFRIVLPGAAERKKDLEILADGYYNMYLEKYSRYHVLTQEAKERILGFPWDNNDIQLESFCESMILTAKKRKISGEYVQELLDAIYGMEHIQQEEQIIKEESSFVEGTRKKEVQAALVRYNGNRMMTAKALGVSTSTLWRYMKKYGLN